MPARLLSILVGHPRRTLLAALAFVVVAAGLGGPVVGALESSGGFTPRDSESAAAIDRIEAATGRDAGPGVVLVVRPRAAPQTGAGRAELAVAARELAAIPGVAEVDSFAASGNRALLSRDGRSALVTATLRADADESDVVGAVDDRFGERRGVLVGGSAVAGEQLGEQVSTDLGRAEAFAFPLLLVLSLLIFRGGRAAMLPLVVGVTTVLGTFLVLRGVNEVKGLSIFALNLVIGLGLGLAIDYTLLLLTRFRDEAAARGPGREAIAETMATAGRTVLFSAGTVAIALASLTVFPLNFLQSMGIGGAVVAILAALAACAITPALLAIWPGLAKRASGDRAAGRWYRLSHAVMRRPGTVAVTTALVMAALALPALGATWTPVDATAVPTSLSSREVADALDAEFPGDDSTAILVALGTPERPATEATAAAFARTARGLPGVAGVTGAQRLDAATWSLGVRARGSASGREARSAVEELRASPAAVPVAVGGDAAEFIDQQAAIGARLPVAVVLLALLTFSTLWLMTGSVVLPLKALVMNALTVGASLGVLKLIFQDGRLEGLLGYTANGGIEPTDFLVTAAVVFALSTDYGVFLLGRIKEARDEGLDEREAVAHGLARTGAVVTAAALLLAVAIGAFSTSSVLFIKQVGVGTAIGVLVDALVVRALLVPSLMALLGRWNWWSPPPLARLHERLARARPHRDGPAATAPGSA